MKSKLIFVLTVLFINYCQSAVLQNIPDISSNESDNSANLDVTNDDIKANNGTLSCDCYKNYPGFGYYKYHHASSWDHANYICVAEGAHLGVINSEEEAKLYLKIFEENIKYDASQMWIGIYDQNSYSVVEEYKTKPYYVTVIGGTPDSAGYARWAPGQPDNAYGKEHCGTLRSDAFLNDFRCEVWLNFICEKIIN